MTVLCYVGNLIVSHNKLFEITNFAEYFPTVYRNILKVHRGMNHDYPGMYLESSEPGALKVSMIKYSQNVLDEFTEELRGTSAMPSACHIFQKKGGEIEEFYGKKWR